jgi:hypothetical protein
MQPMSPQKPSAMAEALHVELIERIEARVKAEIGDKPDPSGVWQCQIEQEETKLAFDRLIRLHAETTVEATNAILKSLDLVSAINARQSSDWSFHIAMITVAFVATLGIVALASMMFL